MSKRRSPQENEAIRQRVIALWGKDHEVSSRALAERFGVLQKTVIGWITAAKRGGDGAEKRGAKLQLTPVVQSQICTLVRLGCTWEEAGAGVGLDDKTLLRWKARGEKDESGPFREFYEAVSKARKGRYPYFVAELAKAAKKDPATLRWLAERVERQRFRPPKVDVEINRELEHVLERLKQRLSPELYEAVLAAAIDPDDGGGAGEDSPGEAGPPAEGGGEAVRTAPAAPEAGGGTPD